MSTYGLVIPEDSPNTSPDGDPEDDGYANLGAGKSSPTMASFPDADLPTANDWGTGIINVTATGSFSSVDYTYELTPAADLPSVVIAGAGVGKV